MIVKINISPQKVELLSVLPGTGGSKVQNVVLGAFSGSARCRGWLYAYFSPLSPRQICLFRLDTRGLLRPAQNVEPSGG